MEEMMENNMEGHDPLHNNAGFIGTNEQFLNALGVIASRKGTDGIIAAVALEQLDIRADLASPSAPAEVVGLVDEPEPDETRTLAVAAVWKPCVHGGGWWIAKNADGCDVLLSSDTPQAATALTALQAENERLRGELDNMENLYMEQRKAKLNANYHEDKQKSRAEKAEAERDALKANAETLAEAVSPFADVGVPSDPMSRINLTADREFVIAAREALAAHTKLKGDV